MKNCSPESDSRLLRALTSESIVIMHRNPGQSGSPRVPNGQSTLMFCAEVQVTGHRVRQPRNVSVILL